VENAIFKVLEVVEPAGTTAIENGITTGKF
jgi:hypothetical protein